ncbi:NAD(FAD)-utilizing dehydrogenase [Maricaulis sp. W15]|uniref:TIGR03862 family flavoprotein n=1 Tax=Maricaulis sp. W15 TaxID=1772333 RepID=UPI0009491C8B|nr:TIGR03862 family flavoprotein [Maricaulis sp. W15]OLF81419.1 NAD(FAD)-utilizing dehydrogenase [Maricaulis sp. W15]
MSSLAPRHIAIIGAGPAGLIAAEHLALIGHRVDVHERMPTPGRKFLMAGRGGLNLTHSEPLPAFLGRYREAADWLGPAVMQHDPGAVRAWCDGLGQASFVGSSGRVFPEAMKASPLLRAWRMRLEEMGVSLHLRQQWVGWSDDGALMFETPDGRVTTRPDAVLLALGGASWPRLGSDGGWADLLSARGVELVPFSASNCGVETRWSAITQDRFAGAPLKTIALSLGEERVAGEAMIARYGLEGGAVYALAGPIRDALATGQPVTLHLDLKPHRDLADMTGWLGRAKKGQSLTNTLRKAGLTPQAISVLRDAVPDLPRDPGTLARLIKAVPLTVTGQRGLERAISSAGGIARTAVDGHFMLNAVPGVFAAGEMLDWDAPTGGYLLQACFATGMAAARGIEAWLAEAD